MNKFKSAITISPLLLILVFVLYSPFGTAQDSGNNTEANKAVVERFIHEVLDNENYDLMDEIIAENYYQPSAFGTEFNGRDEFKDAVVSLGNSVSTDYTIDMMIAEDDLVAVRLTVQVVHGDAFEGANTNVEYTQHSIAFYRVVDGQIAEGWIESNDLEGLVALGLIDLPLADTIEDLTNDAIQTPEK